MRVVTFDLWHTLVQLDPVVEDRYLWEQERTLAEVVAAAPPQPPGPRAERLLGPREAARAAFAAAVVPPGRGSPVLRLGTDAGRLAGRSVSPERWLEAIESLVYSLPFESVPGAREELQRLAEEGYRIGVVSNLVGETGRSMRRILERLGLARWVESWALSEELPWAKPAPEIFLKALEPLGCAPANAVHFGDLGADIDGARAAGFRSAVLFEGARRYGAEYARLCHVDRPIVPPPAHRLAQWSDLPALLPVLFPD